LSNDVPGRPDQGRRPTKAERKDEARREREALQQKLASKRRARRVGIIVGVLVLAAVIVGVTLLPSGGDVEDGDALLRRAGAAAEQSGCTDVTTTPPFDPEENDRSHISTGEVGPPLSAYPTIPPASGPHADIPLPAGVYNSLTLPQLYQTTHSLEHGATIVWYDPSAPPERIDQLIAFYDRRLQDAQVGQDRVIVAPFDFPDDPDGLLPDGTQMALVAWHRLRTCAQVDLAVAFDFTSQYSFPTSAGRDYQGDAPEPGASIG
jgi:Protein of unknown function (DUF3105)